MQKIFSIYNDKTGNSKKKALAGKKSRVELVRQRWAETFEADGFKSQEDGVKLFASVFEQHKRRGVSDPGSRYIGSIDWLMRAKNFEQVMQAMRGRTS